LLGARAEELPLGARVRIKRQMSAGGGRQGSNSVISARLCGRRKVPRILSRSAIPDGRADVGDLNGDDTAGVRECDEINSGNLFRSVLSHRRRLYS